VARRLTAYDVWSPRPVEGRIGSIWPVLVNTDSQFVVAGEAEAEGTVVLEFSEPDQPSCDREVTRAVNVRGGIVWIGHPRKMHRRDVVTLTWPDGRFESITIDSAPE
jgi:hypothetical protein